MSAATPSPPAAKPSTAPTRNALNGADRLSHADAAPSVIELRRVVHVLIGGLSSIGFDAQFAEHIFSPFKRLHARTEYEGSGIGLSVCRKITDRHHGRIVAQSRGESGAIFTITLPLQQPQIL